MSFLSKASKILRKGVNFRMNPISTIGGWNKDHAPNAPQAGAAPDDPSNTDAANERAASARLAASRRGYAYDTLMGSDAGGGVGLGNLRKAPQTSVADNVSSSGLGSGLAWRLLKPKKEDDASAAKTMMGA